MRALSAVLVLAVLMGCGEGGGSSGQAVITGIDPSPGSRLTGRVYYTFNVSFSEPPSEVNVSGAFEWSLQGSVLVIKAMGCADRYAYALLTIQIKWDSGAKELQYVCR